MSESITGPSIPRACVRTLSEAQDKIAECEQQIRRLHFIVGLFGLVLTAFACVGIFEVFKVAIAAVRDWLV